MKLAAKFFRLAADSHTGVCNDTDLSIFDGFSDEERISLAGDFMLWNGDQIMLRDFADTDDAGRLREFERIHDDSWMAFFAAKLSKGHVVVSFPVRVLPHYGPPESREVVSDPAELGAAIQRGLDASPVHEVSFENADTN